MPAIPAFLARLDEASAAAAAAEYPQLLERLRQDAPDAAAVTIADFWYVLGAIKREEYDVDAQEVRVVLLLRPCAARRARDDGTAAGRPVRAGGCRDLA